MASQASRRARPGRRVEGLRRRWRELLAEDEGAVMAEAVIMMPVLILIWAIILYIHFSFRDAQRNMATMRNDAWVHGFGGCNSTPTSGTNITDASGYDGDGGGSLAGVMTMIQDILSAVFQIDEFGADREVSVTRPNQLGGGTHELRWDIRMLCNEDQRGDDDTPWYEKLFDFFS